ncbi:hypothetical protein ACFLX7_00485 [Chloroflexota bacterium]
MMNNELAQYRRDAKLISWRKQQVEIEWQILRLGAKERDILKEIDNKRQMLKSKISLLEAHIKRFESEMSE